MIRKKIGPKSFMNKQREAEEGKTHGLPNLESATTIESEKNLAPKVVSSERKRLIGPKSRVRQRFQQSNGDGENAEIRSVETRIESSRNVFKSAKRIRSSSSSSLSSSDDFEPEKKDSKGRPRKKAYRKLFVHPSSDDKARKSKTGKSTTENGLVKILFLNTCLLQNYKL